MRGKARKGGCAKAHRAPHQVEPLLSHLLPGAFLFFFAYEAEALNTFYKANFCSKEVLWTGRKLSPLAEPVSHVGRGTPEKPVVVDAVGAGALSRPSLLTGTPISQLM